jgi:hypothetical protein
MKLLTALLLVSIFIVIVILVTKFAIPYFTNKNNGQKHNDNKPHPKNKKYKIDTTPMSLYNNDYDGIAYLFWHVNNAMGIELANFPWDPNSLMKEKVKYFVVGLWPTWVEDDYNKIIEKYGTQYKNCLANQQTTTGGIEKIKDLIQLCMDYSNSIGAQFVPFLLPPINGWSSNIKTAKDILLGLDGQLLIMKEIYNCPCQGILIEGEEHYLDVDNNALMADKILCSLRSSWSKNVPTKATNNLIVAWSEQGPMDNIKTFDTATTDWTVDLSKSTSKTISPAEFTWPDSYEGNWTENPNKFGTWTYPGLLSDCKTDKTVNRGGCPPEKEIASTYGLFQETVNNSCCAGFAKGYTNDGIGRYCISAEKYPELMKDKLWSPSPINQVIFTVGGPGADLAIQYSGLGSNNANLSGGPPCKDNLKEKSKNLLLDLFNSFNKVYTEKGWGLLRGKSLALYG